MPRTTRTRLGALLAAGLLVAACAGTSAGRRWSREIDAADRLLDQEEYAAAEAAYLSLYERTDDRLDQRYFLSRLGRLEERRGDWEAAVLYYLQLMDHWELYVGVDDRTPWALFRTGLILYDELGREEEAVKVWRHVIHYFPEAEGPAHRSLEGLVVHFEQNALQDEAVRFFAREYRSMRDTPVGPKLLYWLAYWHHTHLGQPNRAIEHYRLLRERYMDNLDVRDNAEWNLVLLLHEQGYYEEELDLLREIIDERTVGPFLGPDSTHFMELATFRHGTLLLEHFGDLRGAIEAFETFCDVWVASTRRNDAILNLMYLWMKLGETDEVIATARRYIEDYPRSHRVPEVIAVLEAHGGEVP